MLNILYGREGTDKEKFIFDQIKVIDGKEKILVIVPDQYTLDCERALFDHLGKTCLMDTEVLSMSRLGYRLIEESGGAKRTFIDKYGRHMILSEVAREKKDELKIFKGLEEKNSFIDFTNNFISELKQYNCGTNELLEMAQKVENNSFVKGKLEDLYLLYSNYEKRIEGKYTDSEDYIDLYLEKIKESEFLNESTIWVYNFDSFSPKNLEVLGELMTRSKDVNIVLTYDDNPKARDSQIFALSKIVLDNLIRVAEVRGVKVNTNRIEGYEAETKDSIKVLEKELYSLPFNMTNHDEGITLVSAANLYNEAESAAVYVLKLIREEGYRLKDIRLICNDMDVRGPILKRTFKEYGIDLFTDTKRSISESVVAGAISKILEVIATEYRTHDILGFLKSGLSDLNQTEVVDLENYAIKYRIKGTMWKKPFIKGESEYGLEELGRLNTLREKAILPFELLEERIKEVKTNSDFIETFYDYLYNQIFIPEKIMNLLDSLSNEVADETAQVWGKAIGILDQMKEITGDEEFEIQRFKNTFDVGLSQVEIGLIPPSKDGLLMGTMQRTRFSNARALVVIGANEGILPKESASQGLFTGDEKEFFKEKGIELLKVDSVMLLEEKMGIYRNLSKPKERLYMSYSLSDGEGKEAKESAIFTRLRQIFDDVTVEKDVLNKEDDTDLISFGTAGLRHLTEALSDLTLGNEIKENWKETLDWYKANDEEIIESLKKSLAFTNKAEDLGRESADALFRKDTDTALSLSPSRLERYSKCPFSHLITYGLKADERRTFEVAPREIGDIYHASLMKLTDKLTTEAKEKGLELTDPVSPWMTITYSETEDIIKRIVSEEVKEYREGVFSLGNSEIYRTERLKDAITKVAWNMIGQLREGTIINSKFETRFGRGRDIEPVTIELEDKTVYIEGVIDRVDYLKEERVKIIDYKTGDEKFDSHEAEEGYRLQLMLYLKAAKEGKRKPAGIFYFHVHEPLIDGEGKEADKIAEEVRKDYKLSGIVVNDPKVISGILGDFEGHSKIASVHKSKEGNLTGSGLMNETDFSLMEDKVDLKIKEICEDLISGKVAISPMKSGDNSACTYCKYKGICRFDTIFSDCKWRVI